MEVHINFNHVCSNQQIKSWVHDYEIRKGSTVLKLKQVMVAPNGKREDANAFELRRHGLRVPDFKLIWHETSFDFVYLGHQLGGRKAQLDEMVESGKLVDMTGKWVVHNPLDGSSYVYVFYHDLESQTFSGRQDGVNATEIFDGKVVGLIIEWKIGDFFIKGKIEDKGRWLADLQVFMGQTKAKVATCLGMREADARSWQEHKHYDLKRRADVEQMKGDDLWAVKRKVQEKGYSGFALWKGFAYMKAGGSPLTKMDLEFAGEDNPVIFYLYNPTEVDESLDPVPDAEPNKELAPPAERELPPTPSADAPLVEEVEVLIQHALPEMESQISVRVMSNCTIRDVRKAVMAALGESRLSEVKLVRRRGKSMESLENDELIGSRREFLSMGRSLKAAASAEPAPAPRAKPAAAPPPTEVRLLVRSSEDGAEQEITLPRSTSVKDLKAKLCEQVMRGPTSKVILETNTRQLQDSDRVESFAESASAELTLRGIALGPPREVSVVVVHAAAKGSVTVPLLDTCTVKDLRQAVATKTGCSYTEVRIVKKLGKDGAGGWTSATEGERLNGRTEFSCMGKVFEGYTEPSTRPTESPALPQAVAPAMPAAASPPAPAAVAASPAPVAVVQNARPTTPVAEDAELEFTITIDRAMEFTMTATAQRGSTVAALKQQLAAMDPTGSANPNEWSMAISPKAPNESPVPLPDSALLTEEHLHLDLIPV